MDTNKSKNIEKVLQSEKKISQNINSNENETLQKLTKKEINLLEENIHLKESVPLLDKTSSSVSKDLKNMEQIIVKPRETYLKEKMNKTNYSQDLINNISKDMNVQVNEIKIEIEEEKVSINKVPKDLNKIMEDNTIKKEKKLIKYSEVNYKLRKKQKILKELKNEQNLLRTKLNKIEENESLLKSEGFMNLNNSYDAITPFDKNIKEQEMKNNKNKKNDLIERLKETEFRIEQIIKGEEENKISKKEKLDNFTQSIEKDKEMIKARADKYLKESKERNKRLINDIDKLVEKRKKEIEQKEKEDEAKKKELIDKFKEREKKIERERSEQQKNIIMKNYMPYRLQKLNKNKSDYSYDKLNKKYIETENNLMIKINKEKQLKNRMITSDDLQHFYEKIEATKDELKKKKEIRDLKEKEKF